MRGFLAEATHDGIPVAGKGTIAAGSPEGGYYVEPHLLRDVPPGCRLACDEVFGPVASIIAYDSLDEPVNDISNSGYGLQCGVYTDST